VFVNILCSESGRRSLELKLRIRECGGIAGARHSLRHACDGRGSRAYHHTCQKNFGLPTFCQANRSNAPPVLHHGILILRFSTVPSTHCERGEAPIGADGVALTCDLTLELRLICDTGNDRSRGHLHFVNMLPERNRTHLWFFDVTMF
jgi:hypothetical protein